jgi:hypothetical protein
MGMVLDSFSAMLAWCRRLLHGSTSGSTRLDEHRPLAYR